MSVVEQISVIHDYYIAQNHHSKKRPVEKIRHENVESDERCEKIYFSYSIERLYFD